MKETVKMSRAVGYLEKIYSTLNQDKFDGKLPIPIITVQSRPGTWGHCSKSKIWRCKDSERYEMNIAAGELDKNIEKIIDTMLHEMVHLYCRENGIQEVSRNGTYHNMRFRREAEKVGLRCVEAGAYGWNTTEQGNDSLLEYILEKGWTEIKIGRSEGSSWNIGTEGGRTPAQWSGEKQPKAPSSTRKYKCPKCGNSFRATKDINVICGDCMIPFEKV